MRGVAITTTVLAVMTAIVSARSSNCVAQTQVLTAEEGIRWTYYQHKNLKAQLSGVQRDALVNGLARAADPEQIKVIEEKIAAHDREIRLNNGQMEINEAKAMEFRAKKEMVSEQGNWFTLSAVLFQIAIMLSSVSALLKKKFMWLVGLLFGAAAMVCGVNALFLFF